MLTTADYLAFERRVVRNRMDLLFLSGEIERVDGLDQAKGEPSSVEKNLGQQGPSELEFPPRFLEPCLSQKFFPW